MNQPVQPIFIMPEGTQRTTGKSAQQLNIAAAKALADTIRTTLGPKGMDKMIVDSLGDVTITNDGATILKEMQIEHPTAKMIVEVAKTQETEVGDGTTTVVVLAGELLKQAENLLEKNVHATVLAKGYLLAAEKAEDILNSITKNVKKDDSELLLKIALTAMTGKGAEIAKEKLAKIAVDAVKQVESSDDIKIEKRTGSGIDSTELVQGIIIDKERVHSSMPSSIREAKIALIDSALEIKSSETDAKIQITDPAQLTAFVEQEERILKNMVEKIKQSGANVIFCQKGIDDIAQHFLAKAGILAIRRVKKSDMNKLARATGANSVSNLNDLKVEELGYAGLVEEKKLAGEELIYVQECRNPKAVTILVRGGTEHVIAEIKRAMEDAIGVLFTTIKSQKAIAGAGSCEVEVAKQLRVYADSLSGREQLAVQAFADAMEVIPITLAENAGLDPIDVITELRSSHDSGNVNHGINVFTGKIVDAWEEGVVEPLKVKTQAIQSASEVAIMILRIDDVIAGGKSENQPHQGMQGMHPGMM